MPAGGDVETERVESAQRARRERPALIFFGSHTSGPSRRVEGFLAQVLQHRQNHDTFRLYHVDGEARPDLVERYRIEKLPTLVVVEGKRVRARFENPGGVGALAKFLGPWLR